MSQFVTDHEKPSAPERAIDVDRARHAGNAVFREHDDPGAVSVRILDDLAANTVDRPKVDSDRRMVRPDTLQTVIQMREIDQREGRLACSANVNRSPRNPFA